MKSLLQRWLDRLRPQARAPAAAAPEDASLGLGLAHARDVILLFDADQRIVQANDRTLALYGRTPREMLRLTARDLRSTDTAGQTGRDFAAALGPEGITFETCHRRKDGSVFPVEVSSRSVEIAGRRHVLSIVRDITERRRLAEELALQQSRFRAVFDHAPVGMSLMVEGGTVLMVNAEHERITGVSAADSAQPGVFARASHPEDYARQQALAEKFTRGEVNHYTVEKRYLHPDGRVQWAELTSRFFPSPVPGERWIVTTLTDISSRKAQLEEIERLNRLYFVISKVNEIIVRAKSSAELFPEICRTLVEVGGFKIAWIGWLDPASRVLEPVAIAGDETGYVGRIRISSDPTRPEGRGPSGQAFRQGRTCILNDFLADPDMAPWRESARAAGFRSALALPVKQEGHTVGQLTVYAVEQDFFAHREIELLEETADDLGFALDGFAREEKQRAAEAALRASEGRLQFLLTATPAIIYSLRADGTFATTFLSPNIREVLGYEPAAAVGANFWRERVHPDDTAAAHAAIASLAKPDGPSVITREYRFRHADGSWRWMRDETRTMRDAAGRPQELVGYWIDITEAKRHEAALRESEGRYRHLFAANPQPMWVYDLATLRFLAVNDAAIAHYGYTHDEFLQMTIADIRPPDDLPRLQENLKERAEGLEHSGIWRHRRKDGSVIEVDITSHAVDFAGQPARLVLTTDITERMRVERKLRQLSRTIEQAPLSIAITDLTGAIEYVNPAFLAVTGYTRAEVLGQNPRVLKSGETPPQTYTDMWQTLVRGEVWRGELINKKKNGDSYHERAVIAPVTDDTGKVTHYVALKEDITQRKQTDAELQKLQQLYRLIAENTSDSIWIYDLAANRFTYSSPAVFKLRGYTPEEVLQQHMQDALTPESVAYVTQALPARLARFAAGDGSARNSVDQVDQYHRNGSIIHTEISTTLLTDAAGRVTQILGVTHDITARRQAELALQRFNTELEGKVAQRTEELAVRNRQTEALLSAIPDTVMRLRADGTTVFSQRAQGSPRLAAITPQPDTPPAYQATISLLESCLALGRQALAEKTTIAGEAGVVTPGGPVTVELRTAPTGAGEFVVFARDITARKRLETETAILLERERQVSEMKTRFISVTSHEFRTPMTAIMSSVELLANHLEKLEPAKRAQHFARIQASLQRMTVMLDDMLTLNRMDAGRTEVRSEAVDLVQLIHRTMEEIQAGDQDAHRIVLDLPEPAAPLVTDPGLLHHILSNLLSNAVRYSPAGTVITLRAVSGAEWWRVEVEDQGIGIPPADHDRIFEPFERGSNVGTIRGTGLGLNIVKRMTGLLGGRLGVDRPPSGRGSRFWLELPVAGKPGTSAPFNPTP